MGMELSEVKSTLRSLVVSSPTRVDLRSLLRDYRSLVGSPLPLAAFGYRDPLTFLKERCADCFILQGPPSNPILTLIVPDTLKHIDKFVQRQKATPKTKMMGKRISIPGPSQQNNLIVSTYKHTNEFGNVSNRPVNDHTSNTRETGKDFNSNVTKLSNKNNITIEKTEKESEVSFVSSQKSDRDSGTFSGSGGSQGVKKRLPVSTEGTDLQSHPNSRSSQDNSSTSSQSSSKRAQAEALREEVFQIIKDSPGGVCCLDLPNLYRERYGRELDLARFRHTSIVSVVEGLGARVRVRRHGGGWRVSDAGAPSPPPGPPAAAAGVGPPGPAAVGPPEDALPGVRYDHALYPPDCLRYEESIPTSRVDELRPGDHLEVIIGEVYSPSHFWLIRLGEQYNIAMEDIMDEMTEYYERGEGMARRLGAGAVRVGQYCAALFDADWHRALIVADAAHDTHDTVKVRHVDYGTVCAVAASGLRPLARRWAALPAQAVRARLGGVAPAAARRWPPPAADAFLGLVRDTRLVATVLAVDRAHNTLEVVLTDTSGVDDVNIGDELIRTGHADPRLDSALTADEPYLYPTFEALESGATPNYADIRRFLRDGIALEYVPAYRRHVPTADPAPPSPPSTRAPPPPPPPLAPPVPAPPGGGGGGGGGISDGVVRLTVAECAWFARLGERDLAAAHWYMLGVISHALPPGHGLLPAPIPPPPGFPPR